MGRILGRLAGVFELSGRLLGVAWSFSEGSWGSRGAGRCEMLDRVLVEVLSGSVWLG